METYAKKIIGSPVFSLTQKPPIAKISQILVNPANGKILGLLAKSFGFPPKNYFIDSGHLLNIFRDAVLIKTPEDLWDPHDVVRADQLIKSRVFVIGARVFDEQNSFLGKCQDFKVSPFGYLESLIIIFLWKTRIIPKEKIIKILPGKIIVQNLEAAKEKIPAKASAEVITKQH